MPDPRRTPYRVDQENGLIRPAAQRPSPNQDDRPQQCEPELVVIHGISLPPGEFGGPYVEQFFANGLDCEAHSYFAGLKGVQVSAHLLLRRDGSVTQFVPFNRRAWHAGESMYRGRSHCNDFSIGIELEGADDINYSDRQYAQLAGIISSLIQTYEKLCLRNVVGHCDIAPQRKTDPGPAFDWLRLYDGLVLAEDEPAA